LGTHGAVTVSKQAYVFAISTPAYKLWGTLFMLICIKYLFLKSGILAWYITVLSKYFCFEMKLQHHSFTAYSSA